MPNMPKQAGDAVLSRIGTVKVNGAVVGEWWTSFWTVGDMRFYNFAFKKGLEPVVSEMFRHEFKAAIPKYLASINQKRGVISEEADGVAAKGFVRKSE